MKRSSLAHAVALSGAMIVTGAFLAPSLAPAQSRDVVCRRCVDTRDIDRRAVTRSRLAKDAVNFRKLNPGVEQAIKQDRTFFVTLDSDGAEATLVTQGPLRMFARCVVDDGGEDRVLIVLTSAADGWFRLDDPVVLNAGDEVSEGQPTLIPTGTPGNSAFTARGAIAADGSVIGPFAVIGVSLNVLGHVCVVQGSASAFTVAP